MLERIERHFLSTPFPHVGALAQTFETVTLARVVISRAFFLFFPCNHDTNIYIVCLRQVVAFAPKAIIIACLRQVVAFAPKVIIVACLRQGFCIRKTR
jgi:hypothetical protein